MELVSPYSLYDLVWIGKAEHLFHITGVANKLCPAAPDILVHGAVLTDLVTKMVGYHDK